MGKKTEEEGEKRVAVHNKQQSGQNCTAVIALQGAGD